MGKAVVDMSYYAPVFEVEINGRRLSAEVSSIISSITIEQELNKTNNFRFVVQDEIRGGQFQWLGNDLFKIGNNVSIRLGYANNKHQMMEGQIQNISANFFTGTAPTFTAEGVDNAYKFLMEKSDSMIFREKTDSQIVKEIAEMAHLKAVVDDTETVHTIREKKGGESYFSFITENLLRRNDGFEFFLSSRSLSFTRSQKDKDAIVFLAWGKELISFRPELNTSQAVTEVVVRSWDRKGKRTIEGSARAGEERRQEEGRQSSSQVAREIYGDVVRVITDRPVSSEDEARRIALSELERSGDGLVKGSGETVGIPEIKPAVCIQLEELGTWFSGKYYVEKVKHNIDSNGYRTTFDARRNAL